MNKSNYADNCLSRYNQLHIFYYVKNEKNQQIRGGGKYIFIENNRKTKECPFFIKLQKEQLIKRVYKNIFEAKCLMIRIKNDKRSRFNTKRIRLCVELR